MKNIYLLFLLFLFKLTFAQELTVAKFDSITHYLKNKSNKERCLFYLDKADHFSNSNLVISHQFSIKAVDAALKSKDNALIALAYNTIGNVHQYKGTVDSSLFYHNKALKHRIVLADTLGIADSYNNLGIAYDAKGDFENALKKYFQALKLYEKKHDDEKRAMTLVNIGIVYKAQKEYKKAYLYYKKANELYIKIKSEYGITVTYGNLGGLLINFQDYKKSLEFSNKAKEGYEKLGLERYAGYPISNIAVAYDSLHHFEKANKNYLESITLHEKFKNNFEVANISNAFANCLSKQKLFQQSIQYAQKALEYAKVSEADYLEVQALNNLAKAHGKLGAFEKAYFYSNLYNKGMDELFKSEKTKAIFELEAKYEDEKKSKLLLQVQNKVQHRNTLLLILSLLVVSIAIISYLIYRQQKAKNKQIKQEFELKSAIEAINSQNNLQEQRIVIARDLHDNIGAQLTFIISSIYNIKHAFEIKNIQLETKLQNISNFTKSTIVELRDTIWAMNTNQISIESLKLRVYNFIEKAKLAVEEITFEFNIAAELSNVSFTSVDGMNIYRVVQEAVHNSIKHAEAKKIIVHFRNQDNAIHITITDDGKGFDADNTALGNGIYNMKKRITEIQGTCVISSELNKGTTIKIELPLKK
ncbi:MAG TPA: sensor histidine kinase [Flavobacterium sp.]|nr:sensor histidine kinase [Flavobacterium sp.]